MLEYFRMVTKKSKKKEDSDTDDEDVLFPTRNTSKGWTDQMNIFYLFTFFTLPLFELSNLNEKVQNS